MLSERKKQILCCAIEEFIKDSSPITSSSIKDISSIDVSTATLRSELNALEAMGFLKQLHTSGGRVPTPQGYRYYVENLLQDVKASNSELEKVREAISSRTRSLSEIVSSVAKIISQATNYPTVVVMNGYDNLTLKEFRFVPLLDDRIMVLIGTYSGYITDTLNIKVSEKDCMDASSYLTKNFQGETIGYMIDNIDQYKSGMQGEIKAFQAIVNSLVGGLKKLNNQKLVDVHREGALKLLDNCGDVNEAKRLLKCLDNDADIERAMGEFGDSSNKIEVTVADESENKDVSVVKAPIVVGGAVLASIGVIGPQRMEYAKIASALKVLVDELNQIKGESDFDKDK